SDFNSQRQDLDREAQNRSRGDFSSQRSQGFQGGGFDRSGGGGDLGVIDLAAGDLAEVIASVAADLVAATASAVGDLVAEGALAGSAVAGSGADDSYLGLEYASNFQ